MFHIVAHIPMRSYEVPFVAYAAFRRTPSHPLLFLGALFKRQVKREGLIRDHWLIFGTGLFIFKTFPFFNYYFGA